MTPIPLSDRIKGYEVETETRLHTDKAIIARLDGRGFSRLTQGLPKPDYRFNECMMETAKFVLEHTHAEFAYTQSDEITLVFTPNSPDTTMLFDGRVQKLTSVLASLGTVAFNRALTNTLPELSSKMPVFDCRVFHVPDIGEAANAVLWRVQDARKNAISMVARSHFSAKTLHGQSTADRLVMLAGRGVSFDADHPDFFRHGSFWKRETVERLLTDEERAAIPESRQPPMDQLVSRSSIQRVAMPERITYYDVELLFD